MSDKKLDYTRLKVLLARCGLSHSKLHRQYDMQRNKANTRGIAWQYHYVTWLYWWINTGKLHQRGKASDKYVMSRLNDVGPYHPDNCRAITFADNLREARYREYNIRVSATR